MASGRFLLFELEVSPTFVWYPQNYGRPVLVSLLYMMVLFQKSLCHTSRYSGVDRCI
jgi:hypothetical protein